LTFGIQGRGFLSFYTANHQGVQIECPDIVLLNFRVRGIFVPIDFLDFQSNCVSFAFSKFSLIALFHMKTKVEILLTLLLAGFLFLIQAPIVSAQSIDLSSLGCVSIVSSGGDSEGSTWTYSNGTILPKDEDGVKLEASKVLEKMGLGDLTIAGSCISFDADLIHSATKNGITIKASSNIVIEEGISIDFDGGHFILWANSNGEEKDAGIFIKKGVNVTTNGGHIWIGGGDKTDNWNGLSVGDGFAVSGRNPSDMGFGVASNWYPGVGFNQVTISSGGGDIYIAGQSNFRPSTNTTAGVINYSGSGSLIDAANGTITIKGDNTANAFAFGIMTGLNPNAYTGKFVVRSSNNTSSIAISINGTSSSGNADGFLIENHTRILSTADSDGGGIYISGSGPTNRSALSVV